MLGEDDPNLEFDRKPTWQRVGVPAISVLVAGFGIYFVINALRHMGPTARPHQEPPTINIKLPPPPPPPPPPPKPDEPQKQEEKQQQKIEQPKAAPKAPPPPAQGLTATAGNGPSAYGLGVGNGEGDVGSGGGGDTTEAADYYKNAIVTHVKDSLRQDDKLRDAVYRLTVAVTFDDNGRATSVIIRDFSGDSDDRIEIERVLHALTMNESLPASMTGGHPWVVRINAHDPG